MYPCPDGCGPLDPVRGPRGVLYRCNTCRGRAATVEVLRQFCRREAVNALWQGAQDSPPGPRGCPSCHRAMACVSVAPEPVLVDVCGPCQMAWFDEGELAALSPSAPAAARVDLPPEAREALALREVDRLEAERAAEREGVGVGRWWPALFGVPVELGAPGITRMPVVTWSTAALVAIVSIASFGDLPGAIGWAGLEPDRPARLLGSTLLTHALVHGGIVHLLTNLYFLLVFGDNVEERIGPRRFAGLLAGAVAAGGLAYVATAGTNLPVVGISGGTSGVLLFYALAFPGVRLGFLVLFRPVEVPIWGWVIFWLGLQVIGVGAGAGGVAFGAHLGGAAAGVGAFLSLRRSGVV